MGNIVELRKLVRDTLNTYCVDPYPTTRTGDQFLDQSVDMNYTRMDTFPKGQILCNDDPATILQSIGKSGHATQYGTIFIHYYTREKVSYTNNTIEYKNKDLISYMIKQIKQTLLDHRIAGYHLFNGSFGNGGEPTPKVEGNIKIYQGVIPVTYYWDDTYGTS